MTGESGYGVGVTVRRPQHFFFFFLGSGGTQALCDGSRGAREHQYPEEELG